MHSWAVFFILTRSGITFLLHFYRFPEKNASSKYVEEVQCVVWWYPKSLRNELEENSNMKSKPFAKTKTRLKYLFSSIKLNKRHGHY